MSAVRSRWDARSPRAATCFAAAGRSARRALEPVTFDTNDAAAWSKVESDRVGPRRHEDIVVEVVRDEFDEWHVFVDGCRHPSSSTSTDDTVTVDAGLPFPFPADEALPTDASGVRSVRVVVRLDDNALAPDEAELHVLRRTSTVEHAEDSNVDREDDVVRRVQLTPCVTQSDVLAHATVLPYPIAAMPLPRLGIVSNTKLQDYVVRQQVKECIEKYDTRGLEKLFGKDENGGFGTVQATLRKKIKAVRAAEVETRSLSRALLVHKTRNRLSFARKVASTTWSTWGWGQRIPVVAVAAYSNVGALGVMGGSVAGIGIMAILSFVMNMRVHRSELQQDLQKEEYMVAKSREKSSRKMKALLLETDRNDIDEMLPPSKEFQELIIIGNDCVSANSKISDVFENIDVCVQRALSCTKRGEGEAVVWRRARAYAQVLPNGVMVSCVMDALCSGAVYGSKDQANQYEYKPGEVEKSDPNAHMDGNLSEPDSDGKVNETEDTDDVGGKDDESVQNELSYTKFQKEQTMWYKNIKNQTDSLGQIARQIKLIGNGNTGKIFEYHRLFEKARGLTTMHIEYEIRLRDRLGREPYDRGSKQHTFVVRLRPASTRWGFAAHATMCGLVEDTRKLSSNYQTLRTRISSLGVNAGIVTRGVENLKWLLNFKTSITDQTRTSKDYNKDNVLSSLDELHTRLLFSISECWRPEAYATPDNDDTARGQFLSEVVVRTLPHVLKSTRCDIRQEVPLKLATMRPHKLCLQNPNMFGYAALGKMSWLLTTSSRAFSTSLAAILGCAYGLASTIFDLSDLQTPTIRVVAEHLVAYQLWENVVPFAYKIKLWNRKWFVDPWDIYNLWKTGSVRKWGDPSDLYDKLFTLWDKILQFLNPGETLSANGGMFSPVIEWARGHFFPYGGSWATPWDTSEIAKSFASLLRFIVVSFAAEKTSWLVAALALSSGILQLLNPQAAAENIVELKDVLTEPIYSTLSSWISSVGTHSSVKDLVLSQDGQPNSILDTLWNIGIYLLETVSARSKLRLAFNSFYGSMNAWQSGLKRRWWDPFGWFIGKFSDRSKHLGDLYFSTHEERISTLRSNPMLSAHATCVDALKKWSATQTEAETVSSRSYYHEHRTKLVELYTISRDFYGTASDAVDVFADTASVYEWHSETETASSNMLDVMLAVDVQEAMFEYEHLRSNGDAARRVVTGSVVSTDALHVVASFALATLRSSVTNDWAIWFQLGTNAGVSAEERVRAEVEGACRMIRACYGTATGASKIQPLAPEDLAWKCLPHGKSALTLLRHLSTFVEFERLPLQKRSNFWSSTNRGLVELFVQTLRKAVVDGSTVWHDLPTVDADRRRERTRPTLVAMLQAGRADEAQGRVGQLALVDLAIGGEASTRVSRRREDVVGEHPATRRSNNAARIFTVDEKLALLLPAFASRRLDVDMIDLYTRKHAKAIFGRETDARVVHDELVDDLVYSVRFDAYVDNLPANRTFLVRLADNFVREPTPPASLFDVASLGACTVRTDALIAATRRLRVFVDRSRDGAAYRPTKVDDADASGGVSWRLPSVVRVRPRERGGINKSEIQKLGVYARHPLAIVVSDFDSSVSYYRSHIPAAERKPPLDQREANDRAPLLRCRMASLAFNIDRVRVAIVTATVATQKSAPRRIDVFAETNAVEDEAVVLVAALALLATQRDDASDTNAVPECVLCVNAIRHVARVEAAMHALRLMMENVRRDVHYLHLAELAFVLAARTTTY